MGKTERVKKMVILVTGEMMLEHDGGRIGGSSEHWIYLTNLKAYNEGYLLGVYLHFPFSNKDLEMAYKQILVGNEFVDEYGCSYEEYFITDYDTPFLIGEYDFPQALAEKYDSLKEYMSYPNEVIRTIAKHQGQQLTIYELREGSTNEEKLGYVLVDEGLVTVPQSLRNYIDYEAVGRDYAINTCGEFAANYFVEFF